jgi:hypothetical protein
MLVSLAIPALLIRNLFPDLDPLLLAGFGVAIYSAYLVVMIAVLWRQETEAQSTVRVAPARVEQE